MNKLEILDKLIDTEDRLEAEVKSGIPQQVIQEMYRLYGQDGKRVAETYYATSITGSDDNEDCPECAQKAKELIEFMKLSQTLTDALTRDEVDKMYQLLKTTHEFESDVKYLVNKMTLVAMAAKIGLKAMPEIIKMCIIKELALKDFSK